MATKRVISDDKSCPPGRMHGAASNALVERGKALNGSPKNYLSSLGLPLDQGDTPVNRVNIDLLYGSESPVGDTGYSNLPVGSLYIQTVLNSSDNVEDVVLWQYNGVGWERLSRRGGVTKKATFGSSDTQLDVTVNDSNRDIIRYTYDGTGTDPNFASNGLRVGDQVTIASTNLSAVNEGTFYVVNVADSYFEVVNSSGTAESNKTIGAGGSIKSRTTLRNDENLAVCNYGSAETITLPTAVLADGQEFTIANLATDNITVDGNGSETIAGSATFTVTQNDTVKVISDGSNWHIVSNYTSA